MTQELFNIEEGKMYIDDKTLWLGMSYGAFNNIILSDKHFNHKVDYDDQVNIAIIYDVKVFDIVTDVHLHFRNDPADSKHDSPRTILVDITMSLGSCAKTLNMPERDQNIALHDLERALYTFPTKVDPFATDIDRNLMYPELFTIKRNGFTLTSHYRAADPRKKPDPECKEVGIVSFFKF